MIAGHPEICLYQPEIPQNTGNIARLCAVTQCRLHLILPLGFDTADRQLRRAGLDYWPFLDLEIHSSFAFLAQRFAPHEMAFLSTRGRKAFCRDTPEARLYVFGQESRGLPDTIHRDYPEQLFRLPMFHPQVRSLNLANAVSAVVYARLTGVN